MIKGFKDFIMKGNVLDLAVAVVIGAAFTAVITARRSGPHHPVDRGDLRQGRTSTTSWCSRSTARCSRSALILTAVINFLIVAAAVYFILIYPMKMVQDRRKTRRGGRPGRAHRHRTAQGDPRPPGRRQEPLIRVTAPDRDRGAAADSPGTSRPARRRVPVPGCARRTVVSGNTSPKTSSRVRRSTAGRDGFAMVDRFVSR